MQRGIVGAIIWGENIAGRDYRKKMEECKKFSELGVSKEILKALESRGLIYATRVQEEAIPPFLDWKDVMAKAPTGTGKTFAFGIPMIMHIDRSLEEAQSLVLAPTRELAIQIGEELRSLLSFMEGIRVAVLYGGAKMEPQLKALKQKPQILVATPGRLMDHYKRHTVHFGKIHTVVLDEADRMLDMGFYDDVTAILNKIPNKKCVGLFSATVSQEVQTVSWLYQKNEVEITVEPKAESKPDIDQFSIEVPQALKEPVAAHLLKSLGWDRVIVFCNTKTMCQNLSDSLRREGLDADCIHGDIRQEKREKTMETFKAGKLAVLVATDVASRGIDVDDVDCVLNYDVPDENDYYIHRIGRTGRARKKGVAWTILGSFPEKAKLEEIAKRTGYAIQPMTFDGDANLVPVEPAEAEPPKPRRRNF